jgi:hypothetical protein
MAAAPSVPPISKRLASAMRGIASKPVKARPLEVPPELVLTSSAEDPPLAVVEVVLAVAWYVN